MVQYEPSPPLCLVWYQSPQIFTTSARQLYLLPFFVQSTMATRAYRNAKEWELSRGNSVRLIDLLPLPKVEVGLEEPPLCTGATEETPYPGVKHSRTLSQILRRRRRRGSFAEAKPGPVPSPSLEGGDKTPAVGPSASEETESRTLDPIQGIHAGESSSLLAVVESNSRYPIVSFSVDRQPPAEIRTNRPLPPITISLKILDVELGDDMTLDVNNLWGQASLVSADGRIAMAQFRVDILTGGSLVAPLKRSSLRQGEENRWFLNFRGLVICEPGYFKIRIALIGTSQSDGQSHDSLVAAPTEQLSINTRLFRVHAFTTTWRGTGK